MNELMRDEILDQPAALEESLPHLRAQFPGALASAAPARIVLTGSGDSYFAPLALQYAARRFLRADVHVLPALEAARYWIYDSQDLLIAISISGEAVRTVEAARRARGAGTPVLAITANEASTLAQISHGALVIPFRSRSRKTPHTTDYLTSLLAISTVIESLGGNTIPALDTLAEMVAATLGALERPCQELGEALVGRERFYFFGAGPHFATAQYGAAKFWEAGGLRAFPFELEETAHGPHMVLDAGDPALLIAPTGASLDRAVSMAHGFQQIDVTCWPISDAPASFSEIQTLPIPAIVEEWSPFVTCLPLQWLCWAVATAKGYDVVSKNGRRTNAEVYEVVHRRWVRA